MSSSLSSRFLGVWAACWVIAGLAGCDAADGVPSQGPEPAKAAARPGPAPLIARMRAQPPEPRMATAQLERPTLERFAPPRSIERAARTPGVAIAPSQRLTRFPGRQPLSEMTPLEVIAALEQSQGPLESAHYEFRPGSEVELLGEGSWSITGGLSIVDCSLDDPQDPLSGRRLWVGGIELEGAPEEFDKYIELKHSLSLLGREVKQVSGQWSDGLIVVDELKNMRRTLDAGVDEEWARGARTWERRIEVSGEIPSPVDFDREEDFCPEEMTLHLVLRDHLTIWERVESEGNDRAEIRLVRNLPPETLGFATLFALKVGDEPEIIELAQRFPHYRLLANPAHTPASEPRSLSLPDAQISPRTIDPRRAQVQLERRIAIPERPAN